MFSKIIEFEQHDSIRNVYVDKYLRKAKSLNGFNELSKGYYLKGAYADFPLSIRYLDSALALGEERKSKKYFPQIYLEYGNDLFENSSYFEAFEYYIKAKRSSDSLGLKAISYKANTNIAFLKEISGDYAGAKNIYLENSSLLPSLFSDQSLMDLQLINYHNLAYAYLKIRQHDSASHYVKLGYALSKKTTNPLYPAIYGFVEGINHYENRQYQAAYDSIQKVVEPFQEIGDSKNLAFAHLYLGKIGLKQQDSLLAEERLKEAYRMLDKEPVKVPELGEVYKLLWQINRARKNKEQELQYLTDFIEFQEIIEGEYKELSPALLNEFDIPKLVAEKEAVIQSLREKNNLKTKGVKALLLVLTFAVAFAVFQVIKRRYYQRKLEEIIQSIEGKPSKDQKIKVELDGISKDVLEDILEKLSSFEAENQFLDAKLTLNGLAKKLNTNSSYLSKVVNLSKEENFSKYLNRLRIEYITRELIKNKKMRNFTVKAIAFEAGFNNAETFSKSFRESNGMYPSRFIKQLTKTV